MKTYGLDLSTHNGTLDFKGIKNAGNDFVILRAGYSTTKDNKFETYYTQAKAAGLKVGAYWYSYALNTTQALNEAKAFLNVVKGKQFEMPVYLDMEDADGYKRKHGMPSNAGLVNICNTFCDYVEKAGYFVGVYASESWLNNQLKALVNANRYTIWCASWGSNNGTLQSDKSSKYKLHQFTSKYYLQNRNLDRDVCYYDFTTTIKNAGLNGFSKSSIDQETPAKKTNEEIAKEVLNGAWGNGTDRKNRLTAAGYDYNAIQKIVNEKLNRKSNERIALEVYQGKWGNGAERKKRLAAAGYDYEVIQRIVNEKYF